MRNTLLFTLFIAAAAVGCKDKKKDGEGGTPVAGEGGGGGGAPATPPAKMVELDASSAGEAYAGWKLQAPEGATAKEDFGALLVSDGKGFQLEVHEGADLAARKKEIEANDVNKLKGFVTDKPDVLLYKSDPGIGGVQHHFLATVKVGGADYSCENAKGATNYTQAQCEAMIAACQSIKK